jgi:hypothetical protein
MKELIDIEKSELAQAGSDFVFGGRTELAFSFISHPDLQILALK